MTWKRPEEWAGEGVDEEEEEGRERLQAIVLVIALGPSNASSPISPRVGAPRVLAALPRPTVLVWERPTPRGLPLGRAVSIILIYIQWVGQVFGEHEHEHAFIINICTTMNWPSILATARVEEEGSES